MDNTTINQFIVDRMSQPASDLFISSFQSELFDQEQSRDSVEFSAYEPADQIWDDWGSDALDHQLRYLFFDVVDMKHPIILKKWGISGWRWCHPYRHLMSWLAIYIVHLIPIASTLI